MAKLTYKLQIVKYKIYDIRNYIDFVLKCVENQPEYENE